MFAIKASVIALSAPRVAAHVSLVRVRIIVLPPVTISASLVLGAIVPVKAQLIVNAVNEDGVVTVESLVAAS